jgi:hypothetical protein
MDFDHVVKRTHVYLALGLLPWFLMYGVSSLPFSHPSWTQPGDHDAPQWSVRFDRPYSIEVPAGGDLRPLGARIVRDAGLDNFAYGVYRNSPREVNVYLYSFWNSIRITYYPEEQRLLAEDKRFRWDHFLTGMHARGGFEQEGVLDRAWAVVVDIVCVAMLVWIATGLLMWWRIRRTRRWGAAAILGGVISFAVFLAGL